MDAEELDKEVVERLKKAFKPAWKIVGKLRKAGVDDRVIENLIMAAIERHMHGEGSFKSCMREVLHLYKGDKMVV